MKKYIKYYPWLIKDYLFLINQLYLNNNNYLNLLLLSYKGLGCSLLLLELVRWILCLKKNYITYYSCYKCINCQLLSNNNHPDIIIFSYKNNNISLIENIRLLKNECFVNPKINNKKIFIFNYINNYNIDIITGIIGLLKLNKFNNLFLLSNSNYNCNNILNLYSLCYKYYLFPPKEKKIFIWIKKDKNIKINIIKLKTIIRINNYLPIKIINFINKKNWLTYKLLINNINLIILKKHNPLIILNIFNNIIYKKLIYWLGIYLLDILKIKLSNNYKIKNYKFINIILYINKTIPIKKIILLILSWKLFLLNFNENLFLNYKLFIFKLLMEWKKILNI